MSKKTPNPPLKDQRRVASAKKAVAAGDGAPKGEGLKGNGPTAPRVWNEFTARKRKAKKEALSSKPSETVPGMDTPIDVLLNRYLTGQDVRINADYSYNESIPSEYDHFDKVEKANFAKNVHKSLDKYEDELKRAEAEKQTKEMEEMRARIVELEALQETDIKRQEEAK